MSLLIFNSSNKISHSIIRNLLKQNPFQKIVCADVYPSYDSIQRFCHFQDSLNLSSKTSFEDIKISEKSDLERAIKNSSHMIYVTHNYYTLVSSKLNLLKKCASFAKEYQLEQFIAVNPIELDHYGENDSINTATVSEQEAKKINPDTLHFKVDLTFGPDSEVVNHILTRFANNLNLKFNPSKNEVYPIHSEDLAQAILKVIQNKEKGKSYLAKGNKAISWEQIVNVLAKAIGQQPHLSPSALENLFNPLSNNFISEIINNDEYRNLCQFINQYQPAQVDGGESLSKLGIQVRDFEESYKPNSINIEDYQIKNNIKNSQYLFN